MKKILNYLLIHGEWLKKLDKAIPVLEKAADYLKMAKLMFFLGNLYLAEDKHAKAVDAIKKGLKKGKIDKVITSSSDS